MKRKASMNVFRILFLCIMMVVLMLFWTLSFFLTNYMYSMLGISPQEWMQQMITSVTGLLLLFLTMSIVTRFNKRIGNKHEEFFQSITDGIQQIATWNFDINIAKSREHNHPNDPFSRIVDDINHMAKQLGEVEEMRQQFISNVSHEIQSPLTSISGFARALKNEELTMREREHYLTIIESESKRLSNIS